MIAELIGQYCVFYNDSYTKLYCSKIINVQNGVESYKIVVTYKIKRKEHTRVFYPHYFVNKTAENKEKIFNWFINDNYYHNVGNDYKESVYNFKKFCYRYLRRYYPEELL